MIDGLEKTFKQLQQYLKSPDRLADTHGDPFYTFVHEPAESREIHLRLPKWRGILERAGFAVHVVSLGQLIWEIVDRSGRWEDWLEAEEPGGYEDANASMRDVLLREEDVQAAAQPQRAGVMAAVAQHLQDETPGRLVLLTDAALLHPWVRADKLGSTLHDKIRCPTVLFYPGRRRGPFGLHFLGFYPEDSGSCRTTILGDV